VKAQGMALKKRLLNVNAKMPLSEVNYIEQDTLKQNEMEGFHAASAILWKVFPDGTVKFFMALERRKKTMLINCFGGKRDEMSEDPLATMCREIKEETGEILVMSPTLGALGSKWEKFGVLGLKWQCAGIVEPTTGRQLENVALGKALFIKLEFTKKEWATFKIVDLHIDDYIKSELECVSSYFKPVASLENVPSGIEIKNDLLALALLEKAEFTNEEWEHFNISDLSYNNYIKVGDFYFKPAFSGSIIWDKTSKQAVFVHELSGDTDFAKDIQDLGHPPECDADKFQRYGAEPEGVVTAVWVCSSMFQERNWRKYVHHQCIGMMETLVDACKGRGGFEWNSARINGARIESRLKTSLSSAVGGWVGRRAGPLATGRRGRGGGARAQQSREGFEGVARGGRGRKTFSNTTTNTGGVRAQQPTGVFEGGAAAGGV